ncbi:MAG: glycosyltransferase family 4 protein [Planctomycetes bacterium]|nr:glycosyltransferase family 4 protein [Planctomycetota bacterium]
MRIAIDALSVIPGETGGGETYLASLLRAMEEPPPGASHDVAVHCTERNRVLFREAGAVRLVVHPFDNRSRGRRLLFEHVQLAGHLRRDRTDVLFAPGNALPLRLAGRTVLGVQSLHSFIVPQEMSKLRVAYFRRVVPWSARRADRVICVSDDLRTTLLRAVPDLDPAKVRVVHEGATDDMRRIDDADALAAECAKHGVEPGRFVLFVSSLNPFKRPERAVSAVAAIRRERGETWPIVLAGRASASHTARVMDAARREGAADLVRVAGVQDRAQLSRLLSAARVMVYPSVVETWGLPPLESMACECPVVASNRTSIPEVCGDAAVLVDPDDQAAFTDAVHRVLHDDELRRTLVERGRLRVASLTWRAAALGTYAVLEDAAASR